MRSRTQAVVLFVLAVLALAAPADEPALKDDFSDYAAESDGSPRWLPQDGRWAVLGGVYEQRDHRRRGVVSFSSGPPFGDLTFRVRFRPDALGDGVRAAGMVFRAMDSFNYYYAHFDSKYSQVIVVKHTQKKPWVELARVPRIAIAADAWHTGVVECKGSHFRVTLDDKLVAEAEDSSFPIGRIGLRAGEGRIQFDDVIVEGQPQELKKEWKLVKADNEEAVPKLTAAERIVAVKGCGYFPVMIRLQDGRLGAVIRAGAPHVGIYGRLDWIASSDGGKTWTEPTVIVDGKYDDRNPSLCQAADGTVVVAYAEASTYNPEGKFDINIGKYELFTVASKDGGKTWSAKRPMNVPAYPSGSVYGRAILLPDGTILMPVYWKSKCSLLRSSDNGETWTHHALIAEGYNEFAVLRLDSGRLIVLARSNGLTCFHSDDDGKTWKMGSKVTKPQQHPADLCLLKSGHVLLLYGNRIWPYGVGAILSHDGGATWDFERRAMLGWDSQNTDTGYPSGVQLDDGTIVVLYYAVGTDALPKEAQTICVRFTEEQLVAK
ncbi:MAG: sialidase family protein [Planctomycetota bacterium]